MRLFNFLCCLLISSSCIAETKEVAITIDDLPLVGSSMNTPGNQQRSTERFHRIVQALVDNKVPATGFIIAGAIAKGQWEFLEEFRNAGFMLGNHTYSHYNLNSMNADKYIADLDKADKKLEPIMTEPKYFRYPYLAMGNKNSKPKVLAYLQEHHYTIAPVTIDSKDFQFNEQLYRVPYRMRESYVNKLKPRYLAYIWKQTLRAEKQAEGKPVKQILLLHANLLNSYALPDIIKMYRDNGYQFISLTDALKNPGNQLNYGSEKKDNSDDELEKELMPFSFD
ncbi:polysaccharide deacetylase family protein [Legionella genomosp. 1]|uniref:polysaccharide deacetylase family protein n=1 Tax=Legionella genomosp. 1 TaxID=1093625 RepID=UPI001054E436|nr:polysaccharide deacetylase family protein [Legionella genomosp. 1]